MVAMGMDWDSISAEWRGKVPKEAIAEAVTLASQMFDKYIDEYQPEPISA
jgi:hypothetical protein